MHLPALFRIGVSAMRSLATNTVATCFAVIGAVDDIFSGLFFSNLSYSIAVLVVIWWRFNHCYFYILRALLVEIQGANERMND